MWTLWTQWICTGTCFGVTECSIISEPVTQEGKLFERIRAHREELFCVVLNLTIWISHWLVNHLSQWVFNLHWQVQLTCELLNNQQILSNLSNSQIIFSVRFWTDLTGKLTRFCLIMIQIQYSNSSVSSHGHSTAANWCDQLTSFSNHYHSFIRTGIYPGAVHITHEYL